MVRHSLDKSERALATVPSTVVGEQYPHPTYTSEEERKVVRKIDCIILPMVRTDCLSPYR
jgi:hypothetical protein